MKNWLILFIAIVAEVIATSALKSSEGFTKPIASIVVVLGYMIAFYCLSLTLKTIPVGIAYAVWSGVGIVLITTVAWFVFDQKLDVWGIIGIVLIMMVY
jgi:small multidrug resistance pump